MFKKLISIGIAAILLFSFAACNNSADGFDLEEYKVEARAELDGYVLELDENDYSEENWQIIEGIVESAKDDIDAAADKDEVDSIFETAKTQIDSVEQKDDEVDTREWGYSECGNFALSISVKEAALPQGQNFEVTVMLKNVSDIDREIWFDYLFMPHISNWDIRDEGMGMNLPFFPYCFPRTIEANSVLQGKITTTWTINYDTWELGCTLPKGTHELSFAANFSLGMYGGEIIIVESNTVVLTVV